MQGFAPAALSSGNVAARRDACGVSALEDRIGTRLLHRTTRVVRLTEAGVRFLADCKRILGEIEEAEASAAGSHAEARGQLAIYRARDVRTDVRRADRARFPRPVILA